MTEATAGTAIRIAGKYVFFDANGLMINWNEGVARVIARHEGICWWIETHWLAVEYIHKEYVAKGKVPSGKEITDHIKLKVEGQLAYYFPYGLKTPGGAAMAMKIAGLPKEVCLAGVWRKKMFNQEEIREKRCAPNCPKCGKNDEVVIISDACAALKIAVDDNNPATNYCGRCDKGF